MSRFEKLSHVIWHCQYHLTFVPKYRYRVLKGETGRFVYRNIVAEVERLGCQIVELNVQPDHVYLIAKIPPKIAVLQLVGRLKGKIAIRVFQRFPELRIKRYWGNHFWAVGYCADTVGLDSEMIRKYVKYQDDK